MGTFGFADALVFHTALICKLMRQIDEVRAMVQTIELFGELKSCHRGLVNTCTDNN
jgi:hypothetical protein